MDDSTTALINHLQGLPADATVYWESSELTTVQPWSIGWVDVSLSDTDLPDAWDFTIVATFEEDDDPECLWNFVVTPDLDVWGFTSNMQTWENEQAVPRGTAPNTEGQGDRELVRIGGGWSAEAITSGLSAWASQHAGRDDLRWEWNAAASDAALDRLVAEVNKARDGA